MARWSICLQTLIRESEAETVSAGFLLRITRVARVTWTVPGESAMMALGYAANLSRLQREHADSSGRGGVDARRPGRRLRQSLEPALGRRSGERASGSEPPPDRGFARVFVLRGGVDERGQ